MLNKNHALFFLLVSLQFFSSAAYASGFDNKIYDSLLKKYVSNGKVDYHKWKKDDFETFEEYIKGLERVSLPDLNSDERKSFWINTYNALTIYAVLKRIPNSRLLVKIFSVRMVPGFFDKKSYIIAGESLTLNQIENGKLREEFGDARIHFVIVCASRSCPEIENSVWTAMDINRRLDESAKRFIRDSTRNRLDREDNILYLSQIFKWYSTDFIEGAGSVMSYLKRYLPELDARYLSEHNIRIKYLSYDWRVNILR